VNPPRLPPGRIDSSPSDPFADPCAAWPHPDAGTHRSERLSSRFDTMPGGLKRSSQWPRRTSQRVTASRVFVEGGR
jgi:hypothetical protein